MLRFLSRFRRAVSGLSAMEFALVAPVMVTSFFGVAEIANYILAARKVASVASTAADLVAQDTQIDDGEIQDIMGALNVIILPFDAGSAQIRVSSVVADEDGVTRVEWSEAEHTGPRAVGSLVSLPQSDMVPENQGIIMSEISFTYQTLFGMFLTDGMTVSDTFYMKPRRSTKVVRID